MRNHWELPIYDADGYFVANEIDRYALNSYMLDRGEIHIDDGQIVIPIQTQRPTDPDQARNWLSAPPGPFRFAARYYGPNGPLIDGTYQMPAVVRAS